MSNSKIVLALDILSVRSFYSAIGLFFVIINGLK